MVNQEEMDISKDALEKDVDDVLNSTVGYF